MAYIGPGSGISVVGSLLGLLGTIVLVFGAVLLWPFRRMLKKNADEESEADVDTSLDADGAAVSVAEAERGPDK